MLFVHFQDNQQSIKLWFQMIYAFVTTQHTPHFHKVYPEHNQHRSDSTNVAETFVACVDLVLTFLCGYLFLSLLKRMMMTMMTTLLLQAVQRMYEVQHHRQNHFYDNLNKQYNHPAVYNTNKKYIIIMVCSGYLAWIIRMMPIVSN
jgi:flagellar biosynthesis protein FlhB